MSEDLAMLELKGGLKVPLPVPVDPRELSYSGSCFMIEREALLATVVAYDLSTWAGMVYLTAVGHEGRRGKLGTWATFQPVERDVFWGEVVPRMLATAGLSADELTPAWPGADDSGRLV